MDDANKLITKIADALTQRGETIAVAESITGGRVQSLLSSRSGSSDYFLGGVTTYGIEQKVELLGVDRETAAASNCVCEQTCQEMALGASRLFGSDFSIATTGYAEPYPAEEVSSPMAYIAIGNGPKMAIERVELEGDRNSVQDAVAVTAILLLWEQLRSD